MDVGVGRAFLVVPEDPVDLERIRIRVVVLPVGVVRIVGKIVEVVSEGRRKEVGIVQEKIAAEDGNIGRSEEKIDFISNVSKGSIPVNLVVSKPFGTVGTSHKVPVIEHFFTVVCIVPGTFNLEDDRNFVFQTGTFIGTVF